MHVYIIFSQTDGDMINKYILRSHVQLFKQKCV